MYWWEQYLGLPWETDRDCFHWFMLWRQEHFAKHGPIKVDSQDRAKVQNAIRFLSLSHCAAYGWRLTEHPVEGDAALLSRSKHPHHIGMIVFVDGHMKILHAVEGGSVVVSSRQELLINGWKIRSILTHASDTVL